MLRHCSIIWPTEGSASSFHSWPASHLHLHDVGNMAATSDADAASKTCAPHGRDEPFYPPAYIIQPFHYGMYLPPSNQLVIANHRLIVNSSHMTQRVMNPTFFQASQPILSSLIRQAHCSYAGCLIGSKRPVYTWSYI